eukprot:gene19210-21134_t
MLQTLFAVLNKSSSALVSDNICGAVGRMIIANGNITPLEQVIPVIIQHLPIKEDKRENDTVMKCIVFLYQNGNQIIIAHTGQLLIHLLQSLLDRDSGLTDETRMAVKLVLVELQRQFPNDFSSVLNTLGVSSQIIETILS